MNEIQALRDLGWNWTRLGAHYKVSEREIRRWAAYGPPERTPAPPRELHFGTAFVVNDTQFPFYDPRLWETTCGIFADLQPDKLIWAGDILDFPQLSLKFKHNAYLLRSVREDVDGFHAALRTPLLAGHSPDEEIWCNGNHEQRYERYALEAATALEDGLATTKEFLQLPDEVRYHPYGKAVGYWLNGALVAHGWRASQHSAYTAKANALDVQGSVITGHTHRVGVFMQSTPTGVVKSYELGHMADVRTVPKAVQGFQNWQQVAGAAIHYARDGSDFKVDIFEVLKGDVVEANGRTYQLPS